MDDVAQKSSRSTALRLAARVVGSVALVAGGLLAVLFALGAWNPWQLVFLEYQFGNPTRGLLVVPLLLFVGCWLALPVRNEVRAGGRIAIRWVTGVLAVIGLLGWGLFSAHFTYEAEELARSGDGEWAVALIRDAGTPPTLELRIWTGSGLATREVAELGRACGAVSARFVAEHRLEVQTSYGDWQIAFDPQTGQPQAVLGPGCSDGPQPAGG